MKLFSEIKQDLYSYVKFIFGGGLSLILNLTLTYLLTEFLALWHMLSYGLALGVEVIFLFFFHSSITFKQNGNFFRFAVLILAMSFLNWIAVYFLTVILPIPYLMGIILAAGVISILNYVLNKRLVFRAG